MEKPPESKNRRRYRNLENDPEIILTDADPLTVRSTAKNRKFTSLKEYEAEQASSLIRLISKIIKHVPLALIVLAVGVGLHFILENWFGDPKFFGLMPIKYMFDAGDIAVFITLFIMLIRDLWREE